MVGGIGGFIRHELEVLEDLLDMVGVFLGILGEYQDVVQVNEGAQFNEVL